MTHLRAIIDAGFGLDHLKLAETPTREPGPGEVRLRVEAVSLNRRDLLLVQGVYNPRQELPSVPCSDGAALPMRSAPAARASDRGTGSSFT